MAQRLAVPIIVWTSALCLALPEALGEIVNGGFETGDFSGWTVTGTAWGSGPIDNDLGPGVAPPIYGWEGTWYANSRSTGVESAVGILRSDPFPIPDQVSFLIGGWSSMGGAPPPDHNYVVLRLQDGTELDRVWAPNHNNLSGAYLRAPGYVGEPGYVEVVDDGTDNGFAWLEVDDFRSVDYPSLEEILTFATGTLIGWTPVGNPLTWSVQFDPAVIANPADPDRNICSSLWGGETNTGVLRSPTFTITSPFQEFSVGGWDGVGEGEYNSGTNNYVQLRRVADDALLRQTHTPGGNYVVPARWETFDLLGEEVYLEVVDGNTRTGFAWIAFADYHQVVVPDLGVATDLYGVPAGGAAQQQVCRTVPFLVAPADSPRSSFTVGASAEVVYLAGMINNNWDHGVQHWGGHPEMDPDRPDQISIGDQLGTLTFHYGDGSTDDIPIVKGVTLWHVEHWSNTPVATKEPFASRNDLAATLADSLLLKEDLLLGSTATRNHHFYLSVKPRAARILQTVTIQDNYAKSGSPGVWGITLKAPHQTDGLVDFGARPVSTSDLTARLDLNAPGVLDFATRVANLKQALYTSDTDIPARFERIDFPVGLDAARIEFHDNGSGLPLGDMLSNIWVENLREIDEKFNPDTGFFHESGVAAPWYAHYEGIGSWVDGKGHYHGGAYARSSDHFATLALKRIYNQDRLTSYVDYVDSYLYFYRPDNDPANGPPNTFLTDYPVEAPPHWSFVLNAPYPTGPDTNTLQGNEEMDGHGATCVGRWVAWRRSGAPTGTWLTEPRSHVYGHSRWDATRDAAEFICWFMDYMGSDTMYSEGETTGWRGGYQPYPTWVCHVALRCSAQMATAMGEASTATRWLTYASRLAAGMRRELTTGVPGSEEWIRSNYSVYPSFQDRLVHAWFSIYLDGYDPQRWDQDLTDITRRTLAAQLALPTGTAPVLALGYGQGWLTKSALLLDDMDSSTELLTYLAKCTWDKNQDYVDETRGIDWRPWMWIVPEGANLMPDGSWHRINDLSNGANQGPAMHALEVIAGVDDTDPAQLRLMPRLPDPLTALKVSNFAVLVPAGAGLASSRIAYAYQRDSAFNLKSELPLPRVSVRLGPYDSEALVERLISDVSFPSGSTQRIEQSGTYQGSPAWWLWVEGLTEVTEVNIPLKAQALMKVR